MADNLSQDIRKKNMSHIRSKDTKPEEKVRKYLFSKGFRYRKNVKALPGSPDIVLTKYKTVIFVNGCFWHMHGCGRFKWPKTNEIYWEKKILRNVERDAENSKTLEEKGWRVLYVWECELQRKRFEDTMKSLIETITGEWCSSTNNTMENGNA